MASGCRTQGGCGDYGLVPSRTADFVVFFLRFSYENLFHIAKCDPHYTFCVDFEFSGSSEFRYAADAKAGIPPRGSTHTAVLTRVCWVGRLRRRWRSRTVGSAQTTNGCDGAFPPASHPTHPWRTDTHPSRSRGGYVLVGRYLALSTVQQRIVRTPAEVCGAANVPAVMTLLSQKVRSTAP